MEAKEIKKRAKDLVSGLLKSGKKPFEIYFILHEKLLSCATEVVRIKEDELIEKKPFIILPKLNQYLDSLFPESSERLKNEKEVRRLLEERAIINSAINLMNKYITDGFSQDSLS